MKVNRIDLIKALELAKPALAAKSRVEVLADYWVYDNVIIAYNDTIGIEVPFKLGLNGGFRGSLLLGLLQSFSGNEAELVEDKDKGVILKCGKSKSKLARNGIEKAVWTFPEVDESKLFVIGEELLTSIQRVLISVGADSSSPEQTGVTIYPGDGFIDVLATDDKSISWAQLDTPEGFQGDRVCVPEAFCEQLLRLCGTNAKFGIFDKFVMAENEAGVRLFGRLISVSEPLNFDSHLDNLIPKGFKKSAIEIPVDFKAAVDRAALVIGDVDAGILAEFTDDGLRMTSKGSYGELDDVVELVEHPNNPDVRCNFTPKLMKRALDRVDRMLFTEQAIILLGFGDYTYILALRV